MRAASLAVSIITYRRSQLLDSCLRSLSIAMSKNQYPVFIIIQDMDQEDLAILSKYVNLITEIIHVDSGGRNVEDLINSNRIRAWEFPLMSRGYQYVVCLEDDVEVSPDIFEFTEQVLTQVGGCRNFWGINYGSFEKPVESATYSKLRYGLHGPASLISKRSLKRFKLNRLMRFTGRIPWDAWVEPLVRTGFMATSNVSRYRDNGYSGTHATLENNSEYFQKLNESFVHGLRTVATNYYYSDLEHHWRADCRIYVTQGKIRHYIEFIALRTYQILKALA